MRDGREQAKSTGPVDGLQAAMGAELVVQVPHVRPDRVHRHIELAGDLRRGKAGLQEARSPPSPPAATGAASTLFNTGRQLGMAAGVAQLVDDRAAAATMRSPEPPRRDAAAATHAAGRM